MQVDLQDLSRRLFQTARQLLEKLHELVDTIDWVRGQETRGAVWTAIRMRLNELPQEPYPEDLWNAKVDQVWSFVLKRYASGGSAQVAN